MPSLYPPVPQQLAITCHAFADAIRVAGFNAYHHGKVHPRALEQRFQVGGFTRHRSTVPILDLSRTYVLMSGVFQKSIAANRYVFR